MSNAGRSSRIPIEQDDGELGEGVTAPDLPGRDLRQRIAGESLMLVLRTSMAAERAESRLDRVFGRHPVPAASRSWFTGILGELAVAGQLRSLPDGWLVVHSVPVGTRGSDIDHIVVSPSGRILTLNTKHSPGGRVWVSPKSLLVNGQRRPYLRNSQHEAARAAKLVSAVVGGQVDALAVIVVVGASLTHNGEPDNVVVVTVGQLVRFLTTRLAPSRSNVPAEAIRDAVRDPTTWVTNATITEPPGGHGIWFLELKRRVQFARRRRIQWLVAAALILAGLPAVVVAAGLSVLVN